MTRGAFLHAGAWSAPGTLFVSEGKPFPAHGCRTRLRARAVPVPIWTTRCVVKANSKNHDRDNDGEDGGKGRVLGVQLVSPYDREIASLALPALGALALDPLLGLVDLRFVGRLGVSSIAGLSVASIVLNISFSVFNFLAIGIIPLVANALYAGDNGTERKGAASQVISAGLFLSFAIGCVSGTFLYTQAVRLCAALGASESALPLAVGYLRARALASPFVLASFVANGTLRGAQDLRTPLAVATAANLLNIILDIVLMFYLRMGVVGAAYATSISQVFAVIAMLAALVRAGRLLPRDLIRPPSLADVRPLLTAGVMLTIRTLSILATIAYATSTAARLGLVPLAAYELCRQLWVFHAMVLDSIAAAAQSLVAASLAAGANVRARLVANRAMQLGAIFGACIGLAAVAAGPVLPGLFSNSEPVSRATVACIRMAAIATPLNGAVFALDGILAACRDYKFMAIAIATAGFAASLALSAVRWSGAGVVAVWGGLNVLMLARAAVLFWRYNSRSSPIPSRLFLKPRESEQQASEVTQR